MTKEIVKLAIEQAEKEAQEKEIEKVKKIVKGYLEKINEKTKIKKEAEEEIRLLKKDLDDLKAGRLDKIKERQEKDEKARDISLIIIKQVEKEYIPYYPWKCPWYVEWKGPFYDNIFVGGNTVNDSAGISTLKFDTTSSDGFSTLKLTATGNMFQNFTGGAYEIGDNIVNL